MSQADRCSRNYWTDVTDDRLWPQANSSSTAINVGSLGTCGPDYSMRDLRLAANDVVGIAFGLGQRMRRRDFITLVSGAPEQEM